MSNGFLPISKQDMIDEGIEQLDFVYVCGDAYVDHPSFGHAIIARLLQAHGYTVGIISQPDWKDDESISILGVPRLGFLVSAGNMDSMVNHYSVSKKRRAKDSFTPGGVMGKRPDYATVVYCNLIRHTYKKIPIIIGGIEASLRRMAHYDYWSNKVKRSILLDSGADLISYGMGERSIIEIADALASGMDVKDITFIDGTVFKTKDRDIIYDAIELPDYDVIKEDKREFARSFYIQYCNTDPFCAKRLIEPYDNSTLVVQNPPQKPLSQEEMDEVYALPYMRTYHPSYEEAGGVPAISEVKFSLISNRGCFGGCNFCALTFHQGRIIQTRSHESIIEEAKLITQDKDFKGYIHDVGGPTAIQAASDAFSYDYPQAFWFRGSNYGYRVSCVRDGSSSTGYRGTFKNFTFKPANREISENAHTRMGDFMDGVQSAVAELNEQTLGMDMEQKIKRIHDYICQRVTYRNDNTLWVHSAASLFLDADPAFVCEGYAKSMKIFCYYMGINCACVSGTAL